MTAAELASDLEARADFIDRDRYDECMEIKETPDGRLLRQAAARLRSMEEALNTIGNSLVCGPTDYAEHNARELLRAGEIARAALSGEGQ